MSRIYKGKSAIIASHEIYSVGPARDLVDYLAQNKISRILYISHPLIFKKDDPLFFNRKVYKNSSKFSFYKDGRIKKRVYGYHWVLPEQLLYVKDFIYNLIWAFSFKGEFDIFIGIDPLNAFAGIILRWMGKVRKVVLYTIDYFPKRFSNPVMNSIYHTVDKWSVKFSDETWNLSKNMALARGRYHRKKNLELTKQKEVPIGIKFNKIKRLPFHKINKRKVTYIGLINKVTGVELMIKALPRILKKKSDIKIEIYGEGPDEEALKQLSKKLGVESSIKFHGWVKSRDEMFKMIADSAIGLVLFNPKVYKQEIQNADPMKVKDYMVAGIPIISTNVITSGKEIESRKCGIIIHYNENELADAIINLLTDEKKLKEYRQNAISYIRQFDFEKIYGPVLERLVLS